MDITHNEERRPTRGSLIQEFEFYFQFIRSLVLDLPEEDDKSIAAAWVHKLRPETLDNEETENIRLRLDYLKLLLFVLQRRHLVGIFRRLPPEGPLEPFPHNFNISDVGSLLLEEDERQSLGGGDAWATPYAIEISNDLKEFVAAQEIPNFGVQVYYAMSTDDPIHKWALFDERRFPKFIREKIEQLKIMKSAGNIELLKSKWSLLTEESPSLKDLEEIANLAKCNSKVKSPVEIENSSQERVYQAYMNYDRSRTPGFNEKCDGSEKSWRKSRTMTTKKTLPDGSKVSVIKTEQGGPSMGSDMNSRAPVTVARSSTVHQVEVKGDDEKAVEAAAQKEIENLMKEHSPSKGKESGPCECPGHNQRPPSRRSGSERTSRQRTDNNFSPPDRKCPDYSIETPRPSSNMPVKSRSPCRSPCGQRSMTFNEEIYIPSQSSQRQRTPCGHVKKHAPGCCPRPCCPYSKRESPPSHCNCKSMSRDRNGARPEPEKYSQRSPCNNRPRTCGSGNVRYEQSDLGSRHRDFDNQGPRYDRNDCNQMGRSDEDRERERRARLRRIVELESKERDKRCPPDSRTVVSGPSRAGPPDPCRTQDSRRIQDPCRTQDSRRIQDPCRTQDSRRIQDPCRTPDPSRAKDPCRTPDPCRTQDPSRTKDPCRTPDRTQDPCPCPCSREPAEDGSSPCIGGANGRSQQRRVSDPCYEETTRGGRAVSPSKTAAAPATGSRTPKPSGYKETEVKSICNKTTRYNCPDKGKEAPVVNKTCIVEESQKIIAPCSPNESGRTGASSGRNYTPEEIDEDNLLDPCQDDMDLSPVSYEPSIPVSPDDRRKYYEDSYSRRTGSPMRYTSTPKTYGGGRCSDFPGDVSRIRRPDDFRELTMKSPPDPDISGATCYSSGESDSDVPDFCDELTGVSPDVPSPGRRIESMGIRDYLHEGLTQDLSNITEDEYVDAPPMSPDDTFSSPDIAQRTPPAKKICPPCPGSRQDRPRGYDTPLPARPPSRPCYETPPRNIRNRVDSNVPLPLPRRPDYSPTSRQMLDDSQTSDSDGYEYDTRRNLLSALEMSDRQDRNQASRTESESVWGRARDEMRSCGCDDDTSDAERYNRRSRYD